MFTALIKSTGAEITADKAIKIINNRELSKGDIVDKLFGSEVFLRRW